MPETAAERSPRYDAVRNRACLVASAQQVFAEHGLDVPLDAVARHAGVGAGTLYRHFPTREALVTVVLETAAPDLTRERDAGRRWMGRPSTPSPTTRRWPTCTRRMLPVRPGTWCVGWRPSAG